ncbi:MAG: nucleoside triphosphate pyrophosphohydrolase [Pseudorhodoplanes sp.]|nr:MAG: nucleoside triphosphate pyrophosphohydrolase [Pseudorhodoplanes sp.]
MKPSRDIARLIEIMAALRAPGSGCPWDLQQTFETIAPYTVEEAYEVADAIMRGDRDDLREELGDLLLQVVFHARMAQEQGAFAFGDVVQAITEKLIRRHPHVFGEARDMSPDQVKGLWSRIKAEEKAERAARNGASADQASSHLSSVPAGLPPLLRALRLQARAGDVGFDWNDPMMVLAKIREEADEMADAIARQNAADAEDEIGDLLFAVVNLARHLAVDPDAALRRANAKFERRFRHIERTLAERGRALGEASLEEMEALWTEAKRAERRPGDASRS